MSRMVSLLVLIAIILAIGVLFVRVMAGFFLPLFLALLLAVIFNPLQGWMIRRCRGRPRLAAALTTGAVMLLVLIPIGGLIALAAIEGNQLVSELRTGSLESRLEGVRQRLGLDFPLREDVRFVEHELTELAALSTQAGSATAQQNQDRWPSLLKRIDDLDRNLRAVAAQTGDPSSRLHRALASWRVFRDRLDTTKLPSPETVQDTGRDMSSPTAPDSKPGSAQPTADRGPTPDRGATPEQSLAQTFRDFKLNLLGGPFMASIRETANPDQQELNRLKDLAVGNAQSWLLSVGGETAAYAGRLLMGSMIMMVSLYFFLVDGPGMVRTVMRLSPLDDRHEQELIAEFDKVSRAVLLATLLSALAQGVLAGIGYAITGLDSVFLLTLLTTVLAMVPFVGAASVWVPASLFLVYEGHLASGIFLGVYGAVVVSTVDNVIKPYVLHGQSRLHPLLALLSVIGGVKALGPIGILVGPMIVAFLQTLLNILHRELTNIDDSRVAAPGASAESDNADLNCAEAIGPASIGPESTSSGAGDQAGSSTAEASPCPGDSPQRTGG